MGIKMMRQSRCSVRVSLTCAVLVMTTIVANSAAAKEPPTRRPNIILIMADDVGYEGVSAYGSPTYRTPNLDKLAATGMLFNHCYSQPICTPSRVQIMTGKYNLRNYTKFGHLDTRQITFGNILRKAGYATAIAGKWQLGGDGRTVKNFGFDTHCLWHIGGRKSRYWNPRIIENGRVRDDVGKKFGPDVMCKFVTDFITAKKDRPFFVYYPMMLPHWPFVPTPDSKPGGSRTRSGKYDGRAGGTEYFPDMVAHVDTLVGRIVASLDEHGLRENTLLIFTADNGCAVNIRSKMKGGVIRGGKASMPDAGTHVAMIAHWKGTIPAGRVTDTLVDFSDLLPTLVETTGAALPADLKLDGQSFLPQLRGEKGTPRKWVFCHYTRNGIPRDPGSAKGRQKIIQKQAKARGAKKLGRFARNQRYKLYDDGRLYDVQQDVLEKTDLVPGTGTPEVEAVRKMLQQVHDSMPAWIPYKKKAA